MKNNKLFILNGITSRRTSINMKNKKNQLYIIWSVVILFFLMVILSINVIPDIQEEKKDKRYVYLGKDAPIPSQLNPIVEERKNILINKAANQKINVVITEGIRTFEKQKQLYQQGRTTTGNIVTHKKAGESFHNYGLAFDYALLDSNGTIIWDIDYDGNKNGESDWFEVADMAKKLGFDWGGDWEDFKDYPHLQMTFGLKIAMLKEGYRVNDQVVRKELKKYIGFYELLPKHMLNEINRHIYW